MDNRKDNYEKEAEKYKVAVVVDDIECMDEECIIFDIKDTNQIPTKHCFVKNEILANTLVVITPEKEIEISARYIPEKNYMDVISLKELNSENEQTIITEYKINSIDSDGYLYQVQERIKEPFEILLNNTPATLADKCKCIVPLIEGEKYEFTYEIKQGKLEVTKIKWIDVFYRCKSFISTFSPRKLLKMNWVTRYLCNTDILNENEKIIVSFRSFVDLCIAKIAENPGMIVGFTGEVCNVKKTKNSRVFTLELSDKIGYECVIINSKYSNQSIRIAEGKRHYISGILSNGVVYVLLSQRLRERRKREQSYIAISNKVKADKRTLKEYLE